MNFNYSLIRFALFASLCLSGVVQVFMDMDSDNPACVGVVLFSSLLTCHVLWRRGVMDRFPLSSLQVFMFCVVTQILPLCATPFEGKSLIFNLTKPGELFGWIVATQLVLLAAHALYRNFLPLSLTREFLARELNRLSLFEVPTPFQLWIIALMGIAPFFLSGLLGEGAGIVRKVLDGLAFFSYAPFLIPVRHLLFPGTRRVSRGHMAVVGVYFIGIVVIGMAINSRGGLAASLTNVGFELILAVICGRIVLARLPRGTFLKGIVAVVIILGPLSLLVQAIQVTRAHRGRVSQVQMVANSISTAFHPARVRAAMNFQISEGKKFGWDEYYLDNPLLNRLVRVKFHDLGFIDERTYGEQEKTELRGLTLSRAVAILPGPVIKLFGIPANKEFIGSLSNGDTMHYLKTRVLIGGRKTGSLIAHGVALFGNFFLVVFAVCSVGIFILVDGLSLPARRTRPDGSEERFILFSPVALISITPLMLLFADESMTVFSEFVIRVYPQMIVLYLAVLFLAKQVSPHSASRSLRRAPALR